MSQLRIYQPSPAAVAVPDAALVALGDVPHPVQVRIWISATNRNHAALRLSESFGVSYRRDVMHEPFSEELVALLGSGRLLRPHEMYLTRADRVGFGDTPVVEALGPGRFALAGHLHLSTDGRFVPVFVPGGVHP